MLAHWKWLVCCEGQSQANFGAEESGGAGAEGEPYVMGESCVEPDASNY
jgi:hypothetical protein